MADAASIFRETLCARARRLRRMFPSPAPAAAGRRVTAEIDGVRLIGDLDEASGAFAFVWHDGARDPQERSVLDIFCELIEGLTPQEAAEHGAHRLLSKLSNAPRSRAVPGIALPCNSGPIFTLPQALALLIHCSSGLSFERNEFADPPSPSWREVDDAVRLERIDALLSAGMEEVGFPGGIIHRISLETDILKRPIRVVVGFDGGVAAESKPELTRRCEQALRRKLEPLLEVYVAELKDQSRIRRL